MEVRTLADSQALQFDPDNVDSHVGPFAVHIHASEKRWTMSAHALQLPKVKRKKL